MPWRTPVGSGTAACSEQPAPGDCGPPARVRLSDVPRLPLDLDIGHDVEAAFGLVRDLDGRAGLQLLGINPSSGREDEAGPVLENHHATRRVEGLDLTLD